MPCICHPMHPKYKQQKVYPNRGKQMDQRSDSNVAEILARYAGDIAAVSPLRVAMDVGYLVGVIRRLEQERSELLTRLHEATTDS